MTYRSLKSVKWYIMKTTYPFMPTCTKMYVAEKLPFGLNILAKPPKPVFGSEM